jgi:hypothetical protein
MLKRSLRADALHVLNFEQAEKNVGSASVETVRSAGALPFAIASIIRGDTKASGARYRM